MNGAAAPCVLQPAPSALMSITMPLEFSGKRVLIFVVAYNAEKTIESVLDRIPAELRNTNVEVLVIDDSSKDATFSAGLKREDTTRLSARSPRSPKLARRVSSCCRVPSR